MIQEREPIHSRPEECLKTLSFCKGDGGRTDYTAITGEVIGCRHGDCAVIAVVHATGVSYLDALESLCSLNSILKAWEARLKDETPLAFVWRRLTQFATDLAPFCYAKHRDPLYGTNSIAHGHLLVNSHDFRLVFSSPDTKQGYCICSRDGDFVAEGYIPGEGHHVATVVNGMVQGDVNITEKTFNVSNIWHRRPEDRNRTALRWLSRIL